MDQRGMHAIGFLNWSEPIADFIGQVDALLGRCIQQDTVIPLPVHQLSGHGMIEQIAMFNANVNCESCRAYCCREDKRNPEVMLTGKDYKTLWEIFGQAKLDSFGISKGETISTDRLEVESYDMPLPCPFLKMHRCSIYEHRPSTCVMYPVQFGSAINGTLTMAVSSNCPEARRLARRIYIAAYHLRHASLFKDALNALKEKGVNIENFRIH